MCTSAVQAEPCMEPRLLAELTCVIVGDRDGMVMTVWGGRPAGNKCGSRAPRWRIPNQPQLQAHRRRLVAARVAPSLPSGSCLRLCHRCRKEQVHSTLAAGARGLMAVQAESRREGKSSSRCRPALMGPGACTHLATNADGPVHGLLDCSTRRRRPARRRNASPRAMLLTACSSCLAVGLPAHLTAAGPIVGVPAPCACGPLLLLRECSSERGRSGGSNGSQGRCVLPSGLQASTCCSELTCPAGCAAFHSLCTAHGGLCCHL
jgi:hypothetical protein